MRPPSVALAAIRIASVRAARVDAHVVPDRGNKGLDHAVGDELRALEPEDVVDQLVLVRRRLGDEEHKDESKEGDSDAVHRHKRDHSQRPEHGVLELPEYRPVVWQVVIQHAGPDGAEAAGPLAHFAKLLDVSSRLAESQVLLILEESER